MVLIMYLTTLQDNYHITSTEVTNIMCIPLTSLEVSNNLLTVNLDNDELYPTVTVTYSIQTIAVDTLSTTLSRKEQLATLNTLESNSNSVKAFFLPIFGYSTNEIEIIDVKHRDKLAIDDVLLHIQDLKEQSKPKSKKAAKTGNLSNNASVSTLADNSQVILSSSPSQILHSINKVTPKYTKVLLDYANQIIEQTNGTILENCTCIIFLTETKTHSREYIAYKTNYQGGYYWLPTAESNHKNAIVPQLIKYKSTILWGGNNINHPESYPIGLGYDKQLIPEFVYGIADLPKTLNNELYCNGFVGIDFENSDPDNLVYNKDSQGIQLKSIRLK